LAGLPDSRGPTVSAPPPFLPTPSLHAVQDGAQASLPLPTATSVEFITLYEPCVANGLCTSVSISYTAGHQDVKVCCLLRTLCQPQSLLPKPVIAIKTDEAEMVPPPPMLGMFIPIPLYPSYPLPLALPPHPHPHHYVLTASQEKQEAERLHCEVLCHLEGESNLRLSCLTLSPPSPLYSSLPVLPLLLLATSLLWYPSSTLPTFPLSVLNPLSSLLATPPLAGLSKVTTC
jgi:hypothetical protein